MAKIMTVQEALASMQAKTNEKGTKVLNRFNKKSFNTLMLAMANDVDFTTKVAKKVKNEDGTDGVELEDVMVTKEFRKWCKKLAENAGIDKAESERIMTSDFTINDVEGLYDFFATALYEYMNAGNKFDFPSKEDFEGSIFLKDMEETTKEYDGRNPKDGSFIGRFESKTKKHKVMATKSSCPSWLSEKRKIN